MWDCDIQVGPEFFDIIFFSLDHQDVLEPGFIEAGPDIFCVFGSIMLHGPVEVLFLGGLFEILDLVDVAISFFFEPLNVHW